MKIHVGFDMAFECPQPTPMIFMVNVHPSRAADLITSDSLRITPARGSWKPADFKERMT